MLITDQVTPRQRSVVARVEVLVRVRKEALSGPRAPDRLVGVEQPVRHGEADQRPHQRLACGCCLEPIRAVAPGVHEVAPAGEDGAPLAAGMVLAPECRPVRMDTG